MSDMWLILNELENEIDEKINRAIKVIETQKHHLIKLRKNKLRIDELRKIEERLSKKGLV